MSEYEENGFVIRRELLARDLIEELNERFSQVAEGRVAPADNMQGVRNVEVAKGLVTPEHPALGMSKMNFIQNDAVMRRYSACQPLLDQVEERFMATSSP
jgi:hypothetical protein